MRMHMWEYQQIHSQMYISHMYSYPFISHIWLTHPKFFLLLPLQHRYYFSCLLAPNTGFVQAYNISKKPNLSALHCLYAKKSLLLPNSLSYCHKNGPFEAQVPAAADRGCRQ